MKLNSLSVLKWYDSTLQQENQRWWHYGKTFCLPVGRDILPPFQLVRPTSTGDPVSQLNLVRFDDNTVTNILPDAVNTGLEVVAFPDDGYDLIIYPGILPFTSGFEVGAYYLEMSDGINSWFSEVFNMVDNESTFIKIEYWHNEKFCFPGGHIRYEFPFKHRIYIASDLSRPSYEYSEEVKTRDGYNFPIQQISYKLFRFNFLAPEFLLDALRVIRLHDNVEIFYKGCQYIVDELLMTDPDWQEGGDIAAVDIEFRTDTLVVINGRGSEGNGDYEGGQVVCVPIVYNAIGTQSNPSTEYTNGQYRDANNDLQDLEIGTGGLATSLVFENGGIKLKEYQGSGVYNELSGVAGNVGLVQNPSPLYFVEVSPGNFEIPKIDSFDATLSPDGSSFGPATIIGLPGATHYLYAVTPSGDELLGTYSEQDLQSPVNITTPPETAQLRLEVASLNCGIFQETIFKIRTVTPPAGNGIGVMIIENDFIVA